MIRVFKDPRNTIQGAVNKFPEIVLDELRQNYYFGCCKCGHCHRVRNIGSDHWYYCDNCKFKWYVGSNLFNTWKEENEDIWKENYNYLLKYQEIEPQHFTIKEVSSGVWERYQIKIKKRKSIPKRKEEENYIPF